MFCWMWNSLVYLWTVFGASCRHLVGTPRASVFAEAASRLTRQKGSPSTSVKSPWTLSPHSAPHWRLGPEFFICFFNLLCFSPRPSLSVCLVYFCRQNSVNRNFSDPDGGENAPAGKPPSPRFRVSIIDRRRARSARHRVTRPRKLYLPLPSQHDQPRFPWLWFSALSASTARFARAHRPVESSLADKYHGSSSLRVKSTTSDFIFSFFSFLPFKKIFFFNYFSFVLSDVR